jgi:hypothetical protein
MRVPRCAAPMLSIRLAKPGSVLSEDRAGWARIVATSMASVPKRACCRFVKFALSRSELAGFAGVRCRLPGCESSF